MKLPRLNSLQSRAAATHERAPVTTVVVGSRDQDQDYEIWVQGYGFRVQSIGFQGSGFGGRFNWFPTMLVGKWGVREVRDQGSGTVQGTGYRV